MLGQKHCSPEPGDTADSLLRAACPGMGRYETSHLSLRHDGQRAAGSFPFPSTRLRGNSFFFFLFGHAARLAGSEFLDQGYNPKPRLNPNHWTTREFPSVNSWHFLFRTSKTLLIFLLKLVFFLLTLQDFLYLEINLLSVMSYRLFPWLDIFCSFICGDFC